MEITSPDFEKIIMWQELESIIREEHKKIKNLEMEIEEVKSDISAKKEEFKEIEEERKKLSVERKNLENDLYQCEESIKKHQIELNQVKKNEEFKALLIEIENLKSKKDDIENKILEIIESIEKLEKSISEEKKKINEEELEANKILSDKESEIKKTKIYLEELISRENTIKNEIKDESVKKRIETLFKNKNGLAVVKINIKRNETLKSSPEEYFCSGCNVKLTSSDASSVKKFNTFIICQNCSRLVYYRG